ncbi:hypothetical protein [Rufibacter roseus]|uniref:Uncharacterized protein n=1 Tax=Rufibacter roseus TaxID=1567108 RepID=A0ABW2DK74_9BACT|nr:hypothetical protein [Rufibacter roseus]
MFPLSEALRRHRARQIAIIAGAAMMHVVARKVLRHIELYRARMEREQAERVEKAMFV